MKLGFGIYRHALDDEHLRFARQLGATHVVVHLCDYFYKNVSDSAGDQPVGDAGGWGHAQGEDWNEELLRPIQQQIESHGLQWYAIENFDPKHWDHILFEGPRREEQMESVKQIIRAVGNVGIPVFGYNFSLTGVTGRIVRHDARGSAQTVGMDGSNDILETPLPNSMAWNMVVDPGAEGMRKEVTEAELWDRATRFLRELVPVAEAAGVRLAAHPDDPPLETVRGLPKLVNQPDKFQRLLDAAPSHYNALEYCVGTVSEMSEGDVYQSTEQYAAQGALAYVHLRNIIGQVPHYKEVFIDEGQVDMKRIVSILKKHNFDGVIIPDHTPQTAGPAPWHAGMAFAMGYLGAIVRDS